jgi:hypothetical protein
LGNECLLDGAKFSSVLPRLKHSILRSYIKFVVAAVLIKAKYQHSKNDNKNTGLFINCMGVVVVRIKINNEKYRNFFLLCLGLASYPTRKMQISD